MNARLVVVASVLFALVLGFFVHERSEQRETIARLEQHIRTLEGAPPAGRRPPDRRAHRVAARRASDDTRGAESAARTEGDATVVPSPVAVEPEPTIETETLRRDVEDRFATEHADAWSARARATATAKVTASLPPTSSLRSVECRETMCRIEATHESARSARAYARTLFLSTDARPWNGALFAGATVETAPGAHVASVYYLMREGYEVPTSLVED